MTDQALLDEAKKRFPEPNYIVNMYDMTFEWASPEVLKVSGYKMDEFTRLRIPDIVDESDRLASHDSVMTRIMKGSGVDKVTCRTKDGRKVQFTIEYDTFEFKDELHLVAKALDLAYLNDDGTTLPIALK